MICDVMLRNSNVKPLETNLSDCSSYLEPFVAICPLQQTAKLLKNKSNQTGTEDFTQAITESMVQSQFSKQK